MAKNRYDNIQEVDSGEELTPEMLEEERIAGLARFTMTADEFTYRGNAAMEWAEREKKKGKV